MISNCNFNNTIESKILFSLKFHIQFAIFGLQMSLGTQNQDSVIPVIWWNHFIEPCVCFSKGYLHGKVALVTQGPLLQPPWGGNIVEFQNWIKQMRKFWTTITFSFWGQIEWLKRLTSMDSWGEYCGSVQNFFGTFILVNFTIFAVVDCICYEKIWKFITRSFWIRFLWNLGLFFVIFWGSRCGSAGIFWLSWV